MFYMTIETNPTTGKFHTVMVEELNNGSWSYVRKTASGLSLKTQDLDYFFHGIQEPGYKTLASAKRAAKRISEQKEIEFKI